MIQDFGVSGAGLPSGGVVSVVLDGMGGLDGVGRGRSARANMCVRESASPQVSG